MIEILTTGAPNTVQDDGRPGRLSSGISWSGAMDRPALAAGNALLGNAPEAAGLEIALFPFRLRFERAMRFAVTGADCAAVLDDRALPPFWSRSAAAGQVLRLGPPRRGARAYVTVAGGIDVPPVMGSRSTDLKSGFGGLEGRGLRRGDRLPVGVTHAPSAPTVAFGAAWATRGRDADEPVVRVIAAAEAEAFDAASRQHFEHGPWQVGPDANRMGYRLNGPTLRLRQPLELFSHGIMPGVIQVPASGQPIIQLADANTCGGYPKIAAVIEADLWRVAQAPVGASLRFLVVGPEEASAALAEQRAWLAGVRATAASLLRRA